MRLVNRLRSISSLLLLGGFLLAGLGCGSAAPQPSARVCSDCGLAKAATDGINYECFNSKCRLSNFRRCPKCNESVHGPRNNKVKCACGTMVEIW